VADCFARACTEPAEVLAMTIKINARSENYS
jgi:hypothetical protein